MRTSLIAILTGLSCLALSLPLNAAEWSRVREADERGDVDVFVKPVKDNPLKAFKGIIEVPQPMLSVMAIMGDLETYPEWVFQCSGVDYRPKEWGKDVIRIRINGIWPVSDRDGVFRSTITQNPDTDAITIHSKDTDGVFPPREGFVRLPDLDNKFIMEPLEDGWTRITFRTFVDPGGHIPAWLANFVATRAPEHTLTNMARLLERNRYAINSVEDLPIQFPGIGAMRFPSLEEGSDGIPTSRNEGKGTEPDRSDTSTDTPRAGQ